MRLLRFTFSSSLVPRPHDPPPTWPGYEAILALKEPPNQASWLHDYAIFTSTYCGDVLLFVGLNDAEKV